MRIVKNNSRIRLTSSRAFTLLELIVVLAIIGFLTAISLPHLRGFTTSSAITTATRQLLDDVALARQRAIVNRADVRMVFLPPKYWYTNGTFANLVIEENTQSTNLYNHQCGAYAIIAMRTVGDQPGVSNVHYLTEWRFLPQGVFISPYLLTNFSIKGNPPPAQNPLYVSVTNTTAMSTNGFYVYPLPTASFPFPSTFTAYLMTIPNNILMPYVEWLPNGQLGTNGDVFLLLDNGSIVTQTTPNGQNAWLPPDIEETPPGNATNNPNVIHIDWLTGRAKLERNHL